MRVLVKATRPMCGHIYVSFFLVGAIGVYMTTMI